MKHLLAVMVILLSTNLFAQEENATKKIDKKQKIQEWTVDGDEAKKILKDLGIDRDFSDLSADDEIEIIRIEKGGPEMFFFNGKDFDFDLDGFDFDMDGFEFDMENLDLDLEELQMDLKDLDIDLEELHEGDMERHFKFKMDNDGEIEEFEWKGDGEMPEELKQHMEELQEQLKEMNFDEIEIRKMKHHRDGFGEGRERFMKNHGPRNKAFLGIVSQKAEGQEGVVVDKVIKDTPAEKAGLQIGDNILSINNENVESTRDVVHAIGQHDPNDEVKILYVRDGKTVSTTATLMENKHHAKAMKKIKRHHPEMKHKMIKRGAKAPLGVYFGEGDNLMIEKVVEGSPAEKAGFESGDQIVEMGGVKIADFESLIDQLRERSPGDEVEIKVQRNGAEHTLSPTLGAKKHRMHHRMNRKMHGGDDEEIIIIRKKKGERSESGKVVDRDMKLEVFPNPTEGTMKIRLDGSESPATIRVYDNSGKEYYSDTLTPNGTAIEKTIQLNGSPSGLLFLHIEQDGVITTEKIILQE